MPPRLAEALEWWGRIFSQCSPPSLPRHPPAAARHLSSVSPPLPRSTRTFSTPLQCPPGANRISHRNRPPTSRCTVSLTGASPPRGSYNLTCLPSESFSLEHLAGGRQILSGNTIRILEEWGVRNFYPGPWTGCIFYRTPSHSHQC